MNYGKQVLVFFAFISCAYAQPRIGLEAILGEVSGIRWEATNTSSLLVETSTNLTHWQAGVNVFSSQEAWIFGERFPSPTNGVPARFYRTVNRTESISEMLARWQALGFREYEFTFQRGCFCAEPDLYRGRVRVRDGQVVGVTNATTFNNFPLENPDLAIFDSVEELFARVQSYVAEKADIVAVDFDNTLFFPTVVHLNRSVPAQDDEDSYEITDLRPLP